MDIYINQSRQENPVSANGTVGDALTALTAGANDMIMVSLQLDGRELDQEALDEVVSLQLDHPGRLEVFMQSRSQIAASALYETADMLASDRRDYTEIAAKLAARGLEETGERLNNCFSNWVMAQKAITQSLAAVGLELSVLPPEFHVTELTNALTSALGHLQSRLKARDSVAVSDLLEYEMAMVADGWINLCNTLGEVIRKEKQ